MAAAASKWRGDGHPNLGSSPNRSSRAARGTGEDTDAAIEQALLGIAEMDEVAFEERYGERRECAPNKPIRGWTATDVLGLVGIAVKGANIERLHAAVARLADEHVDRVNMLIQRSDEFRRAARKAQRQADEAEKARARAGVTAPTNLADRRAATTGATTAAADVVVDDVASDDEGGDAGPPDTPAQMELLAAIEVNRMARDVLRLSTAANKPMLVLEGLIRDHGEPTLRRLAKDPDVAKIWVRAVKFSREFADYAETFIAHDSERDAAG